MAFSCVFKFMDFKCLQPHLLLAWMFINNLICGSAEITKSTKNIAAQELMVWQYAFKSTDLFFYNYFSTGMKIACPGDKSYICHFNHFKQF